MYIKRYTIAAFILMALVGAFVYTYVTPETTTIDFFGIPLPALSVAIWVVVPLFVLYVATILHFSFYGFLASMNLRKYDKDYEKIIDSIVEAYLGKKSRNHTFKTERYTLLGTLLENTTLFPMGNIIGKTNNEKIDHVLGLIEDVKAGKVVELKQFNLRIENDLIIQNERNRYKSGELSAEDLLSNSTKYAEVLKQEVYSDFVKKAPLSNIEKYKALLTKEALYAIVSRVNADSFTLEFSSEELVSLMSKLELNQEDYITLSRTISHSEMIPEQRMKLFEMLSESNEDATAAYLYTLFDLEVLDSVDHILDNSQVDEFQKFKAYRALKASNKHFSIELFV